MPDWRGGGALLGSVLDIVSWPESRPVRTPAAPRCRESTTNRFEVKASRRAGRNRRRRIFFLKGRAMISDDRSCDQFITLVLVLAAVACSSEVRRPLRMRPIATLPARPRISTARPRPSLSRVARRARRSSSADPGGGLPFTGYDVGLAALVAIGLVGAGIGLTGPPGPTRHVTERFPAAGPEGPGAGVDTAAPPRDGESPPVLIVDADQRCVEANEAASRMLGLTARRSVGRPLVEPRPSGRASFGPSADRGWHASWAGRRGARASGRRRRPSKPRARGPGAPGKGLDGCSDRRGPRALPGDGADPREERQGEAGARTRAQAVALALVSGLIEA